MARRVIVNVNDINIPTNPILSSGPLRNIMGHRVPPRRQSPIAPQEVAVPGLELDLVPFSDGLPLERGVEPLGPRLDHLETGHAEQEGTVGGGEVLVVAALEADDGLGVGHELHGPARVLGGSVPVLSHLLLVLLGQQVLIMVATQAHRLGVAEEVHAGSELVGIDLHRKPPKQKKRQV